MRCVHDVQMKWAHDMVLTSMREIFACFEGGSSEVKRERRALIAQTDNSIEVHSRTILRCIVRRAPPLLPLLPAQKRVQLATRQSVRRLYPVCVPTGADTAASLLQPSPGLIPNVLS